MFTIVLREFHNFLFTESLKAVIVGAFLFPDYFFLNGGITFFNKVLIKLLVFI